MNLAFDATRLIGAKVLIIGDIMLDHYQRGIVERISPEAPVPIVKVTGQEFKIGGAGNVAQNIATLGGKATLISICGNDLYSETLEAICSDLGVQQELVHSDSRETTLKTRIMAAHQQMLRVDRETNSPLTRDEHAAIKQAIECALPNHDVIILSDYGKGIISKEFLTWLQSKKKPHQKIIVDPKTCNFGCYGNFYCMTPNTKEASEGAGLVIDSRETILEAGKKLMATHQLETLVITLGADGMAVFIPGQGVYHLPTMARKVFDVTGAGDTVIATIALGLSAGMDLLSACILANCAAGQVVGQVGAVGISQEQLAEALSTWAVAQPEKWAQF